MKKAIILFSIVIISLLFFGCSVAVNPFTQDEDSQTATTQQTENSRWYTLYQPVYYSYYYNPNWWKSSVWGNSGKNYHVMIEAFKWNSLPENIGGQHWYNIIKDNAARMANDGITIAWMPPPTETTSGGGRHGYEPTRYWSGGSGTGRWVNNAYGWFDEQKDAINALHNNHILAIADIVINHRSGYSGWADFQNPYWATNQSICRDDEWWGSKSSKWDTGDSANFARDLAHDEGAVSLGIKEWLHWLKDTVGYDGWRYDMVKGYAAWAVEMYNNDTSPYFSVGEYWSTGSETLNWVNGTNSDWTKRSTAFDFDNRQALYDAVRWGCYDHLSYSGVAPGLLGKWSRQAVLFLENHDTEEARGGAYTNAFPDGNKTVEGYAYIITHPGMPCIYWPDIFDSGRENEIKQMILARKNYKVHSTSHLYIAKAQYGQCYAAYIQGDNGEIAVKIGPGSWSPSGSKWDPVGDLICSGNNYAIWGENGKWW